MATDSISPTLADVLREPHREALTALDDPSGNVLCAVSWAAAHLAAVARVVHPAVERHLPDGRRWARGAREVDRRLQTALWELDRRATGDLQVAGAAPREVVEDVRAALAAHERWEQVGVEGLARVLSDVQQQDLVEQLRTAMRHAPSRPHPDTPHRGGPLSRAAYWCDARMDDFRDLIDSRTVAVPRAERPPRRRGRWSAYLMAQPYPSRDEDATAGR